MFKHLANLVLRAAAVVLMWGLLILGLWWMSLYLPDQERERIAAAIPLFGSPIIFGMFVLSYMLLDVPLKKPA
jgi:hypothetical protein